MRGTCRLHGLATVHWKGGEFNTSFSFFFFELYLQDIDTIYLSLNTKELNIQDFDHLEHK